MKPTQSITNFFLFLIVLAWASFATAGTVDLAIHRRCDPIYKPAGCSVINSNNLDFKDRLAASTGINMIRSSDPMPNFRAERVTYSEGRPLQRTNSTVSASVNSQGDTPAPQEQQQAQQQQQGSGFQGLGNQGAQQAGLNTPPVNIQNPGSGVTTVGGMVYADDEPDLEPIKAPGTASQGQLAMQMPVQQAVKANQGLDTGSSSSGGGPRMPAAAGLGGGGANQFGQVDNSPNPTQAGDGGFGAHLKALASALGEGAMSVAASFGVDGGAANNGQHGPNRRVASAQTGDLNNLKAEEMRNLLKDRYGRYISSSKTLEFGASNSLMFQGMCGHYAAYAAKNRIPTYDLSTCEQQK